MQLAIYFFAALGLASVIATFGLGALAYLAAREPIEEENPCPTRPIDRPTDAGTTECRSDPDSRPMKLVGPCGCASCRRSLRVDR